jgi:hypothetical protein
LHANDRFDREGVGMAKARACSVAVATRRSVNFDLFGRQIDDPDFRTPLRAYSAGFTPRSYFRLVLATSTASKVSSGPGSAVL